MEKFWYYIQCLLSFLEKRILFILQDYICHETISNRTKVPECPGNEKAARERSNMKKCDNYQPCNGKPLVYHCARDNDSLVEACAPIVTILGSLINFYFSKPDMGREGF